MSLGRHVDSEQLIKAARDHPTRKHAGHRQDLHGIPYASRYNIEEELPRYKMPVNGVDPKVAYQLLHDELALDGNPNMNLASFVHTWVPEECEKLMIENLNKNLVDQDEYPAARDIHERCISMIADLWHAPTDHKSAIGTATTGSSEAIMLGGMAMKRRWQEKMKAKGKSIHEPGPNIVMGAEAQVALEKFARYFEVDMRLVPVTKESNYVMSAKEAMKYVDENTIGVFVTYTGAFENVSEMAAELDAYEERTGNHIPIHVDGASGAFAAPFAYPGYKWDFKIPRVVSINASGHKYGASLVGVGWVVWRSPDYLPKDMIFELHYLGQTDYSFNLNFSRPAHPILGQMFNFINLGFEGYRRIMQANLKKARILSRALENSQYYDVLSQIHRPKATSNAHTGGTGGSAVDAVEDTISNLAGQLAAKVNVSGSGKDMEEAAKQRVGKVFDEEDAEFYIEGLPVVSFKFTDKVKAEYPDVKQAWVQEQLRAIGWIVPNYPLPPACEDIEILRVVVRESLSGDLVRKLITDILQVTESLFEGDGPSVSMLLAAQRKSKAASTSSSTVGGKGAGSDKDTAEKHDDVSAEHKKQIADNTSTWAKPC